MQGILRKCKAITLNAAETVKTSVKMSFYINRLKSYQNYTWCDNANLKKKILSHGLTKYPY